MKVCVDVDYRESVVVAACVVFRDWPDATGALERAVRFEAKPAEYESGEFYRREMPYVLTLLRSVEVPIDTVIVDSYVWLDGDRPGFGARLHEALEGRCAIIGVAKRPFRDATNAQALLRGTSKTPLFISAVDVALPDATRAVASMHGPHRLPTLLKRVDRLCREG
jgi:deoxyribonuclease V